MVVERDSCREKNAWHGGREGEEDICVADRQDAAATSTSTAIAAAYLKLWCFIFSQCNHYRADSEEDEIRDAVLVTDGDNEIGQTSILSLIIKRIRVKALVKDKRAAIESFGTYVESITGDPKDSSFLKKSLRGVRTIICSNEGFLSKVERLKGVQHVVILSQR
ncbi:hypothetical protein L2E82_42468 [Cichorium intybus]|uniref:Uncharacterized protein n=1 Tax=Cichorium intybus TaxID=13427 RepID=A0ACB8ZMZ8_CICIN|nr:hypothetical protein L2E82_42468 [Cichorium intybus]